MNKAIIVILIILSSASLWAQQPKDTLNTEVINVVKPYTPTISDAFKIESNPIILNDNIKKESIDYKINSVPAASTFTPSKGKVKAVTRPKKERLFDNYISFGLGNYTTPLLEAYMRTFPSRYDEFGVLLKHHSSQGGIKDLQFSDSFYNSGLDVYYKQSTRDMDWKLNFGATHKLYNWYGLPQSINLGTELIEEYDPKQSYFKVVLGGNIEYFDSFFKGVKAEIYSLFDRYKSNESRVRFQPIIELPISTELIKFVFDVDYLRGTFDRNYEDDSTISYAHFNFGLSPNFEVLRDDLRINLGAKLYASTGFGNTMKLKAYPNIDASYQLIGEVLTIFTGVTGGLHQNTYLNMIDENPYLSPNFESEQTDERYRAYGGVKGKLASNINYLFKGSYSDERGKPLQKLNDIKSNATEELIYEVYELGNSFSIVYDNIKTLEFYGELAIDFSKEFTLGGNLNYSNYELETQAEAWNLPNIKASLFADYHANKWTGSAKLFMMGDRKDEEITYDDFNIQIGHEIINVKSYLDLNTEISYAFTNRLSAFGKVHNLMGTHYKRYNNYPVQGIQVLGGITYKFDL